MTVERLIKELKKYNPKAVIRLHDRCGNDALFAVSYVKDNSVVVIEDRLDNDLGAEIEARFEDAKNIEMNELEFFKDFLETGLTLNDIKEYYPEKYEYSKDFMIKHNLINGEDKIKIIKL